ncbi:hypothetical protein C8Q70DRAFT_411106 [Cubamyces menziesii]|uniref:F-box domain-containing protein n=1 Tax=Trametes cubensis TaxID=1111947 RepID=A0AAD7TZ60_9APHY|nr:hypothetical protein C8Q70DRAFT_411106 [Cubamyces menziesii]KAJ8489386.1 hypothetical protein ONZ51_g2945 [Trametes cubensis]
MTVRLTRAEDGVSKLKGARVASTTPEACAKPMKGPFDRIPVEILSQILEYATEERSDSLDETDIRRRGFYYLSTYVAPSSLGAIMQVCSHWRAVALNTPNLWRRVDVYEHVEPLVTALDRSRSKMVDVSLHRASGAQSALPLLAAHSRRLRKLSLHWLDDDKDKGELCEDLMDQVGQMDLPALEELLVDDGETYWPGEVYALELLLDPALLPSLRIVKLDTSYISWSSMIFSQLRVLHLQEVAVPPEEEVSLSNFLDILAACQSLEELILVYAFPIAFSDFGQGSIPEGPFAGRVVELPKLQLLHLEWDSMWRTPCETYQLLQHLRLRSQTTVRIAVEYDQVVNPARSLFDVVPRDPTCLPILSTGTSVRVFVDQRNFTRFAVESALGNRDFTLLLANKNDTDWPEWYGVDQQLTDFCTIFAGSPRLTRLSIETRGVSTVGLESSLRLLRHLSAIEVTLGTADALKQLLDALVSPNCREETSSDTDNKNDVIAPHLRTLKLKTLPWHPELSSDIERCLEWRARHGTELQELYIEAYGRKRDAEGEVELGVQHTRQLGTLQVLVKGSVVFVDT